MFRKIIPALAALSLVIAPACKKKNTGNTNTDNCEKVWTVIKPSAGVSSATIEGGVLNMSITDCKTTDLLNIYRGNLSGDFTVTVNYESFTPATGTGGFTQLVVADPLKVDSGFVICGIGNGLISTAIGKGAADIKNTTSNSGKLTIIRSGNNITARTESGGTTSESVRTWLSTDCNVGFQMGTNGTALSGKLSIKILDITVTKGSGTWMNEKFDCNSLK